MFKGALPYPKGNAMNYDPLAAVGCFVLAGLSSMISSILAAAVAGTWLLLNFVTLLLFVMGLLYLRASDPGREPWR